MIPKLLRGAALLALLLLSLLFLPTQLYAQSGLPGLGAEVESTEQSGLFNPSATVGSIDRSSEPFVVEDRFVQLDANQVNLTTFNLQLNFFDDADFSVEQTGIQQNSSGSLTWFGKVTGDEDSQVILVAKDDIVVGNVESNGLSYQVRYAGNSVHAVYQIDRRMFPPGAEPLLPDIDLTAFDPNDINTANSDDGSILDVMVLYTPAAKNASGGTTAMETLIDLAVAETNTAYNNSDVIHRLNLVHQAEVNYDESTASSSGDHLTRLQDKTDGYMDDIHDLRDTYKADVVSLMLSTASFCGQGYVMNPPSAAFESWAFNVVVYSCATGNYSFGHEIGHNLGLRHDRANSGSSPAYPYGYGFQAPNSSFRTIMAYSCSSNCTRIQHFSNPDVSYNGIPTGIDHATDPNNSADAARAMDDTRIIAANWRVSGTSGGCAGITEIPQIECEALEALYNSTDGPNWNTNTHWFDTNTPCSWHGLTCSSGHIRSIFLYNNQLNGSIPSEIGDFDNLLYLYLFGNQLSGSIPTEVGDLDNLINLLLMSNQLSGSLPPELADMAKASVLWLHANQFSGSIPPQLGSMPNLTQLLLNSNDLNGSIPAVLGDLTNLTTLWLSDNQLSGQLPSNLGNLSNLTQLLLSSNQLSGPVPLSFTSLNSLQTFHFNQTQLCEPDDTSFQSWLSSVTNVTSTDEICDSSSGNAMIYINPITTTMEVGDTTTLQIMVDPQSASVNGVQVNAQLDPNYLEILSIANNTSQLPTVLEPVAFDANTGDFSYSAGLVNGVTGSTPFEVLEITVRALAQTPGTVVEFQSDFPPTDVSGPIDSVMESSQNGVVIIESPPDVATLYGEIGLQGRPNGADQSRVVPVAIELIAASSSTNFNVTLDENGRFTQTGILSGTYDIRMVNSHTLASKAQNVVLNNGDNAVYLGPLMEGDTIQDNEIRVNDFGLLSGAYNRCSTDAAFVDQTDLNEDNCTDLDDFSLLSGNYNTQGDIEYDVNNPPPLPIEVAAAEMGLRSENIAGKTAGDLVEVFVFVEPNGSKVNGAAAHLQFDPDVMEVISVELLAGQLLPTVLQEGQIDNGLGTVQFSKGALGSTVSQRFNLAKLSVRLKQQTDGTSLQFSVDFPATNVTGTQGSVLAGTTIEEFEVAGLDTADLLNYGIYLPLIVQ